MILTYGGWQRYFGGSPDVIGKTLLLDDKLNTVVGVLPQNFSVWAESVWRHLAIAAHSGMESEAERILAKSVARLKPEMNCNKHRLAFPP